ncbi:LOW QUALITY PROTEIN: guanosine nucleotide diphosphate dissociation inhibitor At5g09550-like [Neltuma alba]|uniref:LOW QUALITY PROTEIN: guanosine nucleotide diphosphate dissociation inhibitor At5g09550-like n=1 Tax=Neltuma alba TaxID=207710 RepID=UPI0010A58348|nr:LOW QUALITY PROTEIN: guanosine nucleotide diphosphate dissociation inhibitor At5g09550-like [Prosopis alba]
MDEEYDVIVLGTGLKECILSGLLSVDGLKVLHMDRNDYYGGESSSLNLTQLWKRFRGEDQPPEHLGSSREYNVDMIPKFTMANGLLVRVLIHTDVTKYLNFKAVDGSFVYNKGKIYKVPATDVEALKSPLMGLFEKRRARKFFIYVQDYEESDPKSHEGLDLNQVTARQLISKYGLEDDTIDFIGHALALHRDDSYLDQPAKDFVERIKLYAESLAICIMSHPIPDTSDSHSAQVILPQQQLGRKSDMYLFCCSYAHNVAAKGKYIAFVSTEAETDQPEVELKPGIELLGPVDEIFYDTYDIYEPVNDCQADGCFISTSYDSTTHFESTVQDVLALYSKITGKDVDLSVDLSAASAATE